MGPIFRVFGMILLPFELMTFHSQGGHSITRPAEFEGSSGVSVTKSGLRYIYTPLHTQRMGKCVFIGLLDFDLVPTSVVSRKCSFFS